MRRATPAIADRDTQPVVELSDGHSDLPLTIVAPSQGWLRLGLRDIWEYRELLYFLAWRDIKVRYKQTAIGAAWAILQPVIAVVVFTLIFGRFARIPSDGAPYPLFVYAALLPWNFFASALQRIVASVGLSAHLISKIYFPRVIVPISAIATGLLDFFIAFLVLIGMMVWFDSSPGWTIVTVPFFLAVALLTALAVGLWLWVLNVKYRDVGHAMPFLIQIWMFASPLVYPLSLIPEKWRLIYSINPMVGVIQGFRWALLGRGQPDFGPLAVSAVVLALILIGGIAYFRRMERTFADVI